MAVYMQAHHVAASIEPAPDPMSRQPKSGRHATIDEKRSPLRGPTE